MSKAPHDDNSDQGKTGRSVTEKLAARIARARQDDLAAKAASDVRQQELSGLGRAFRFASEFIAAVIVGGGLGFLLDRILGTTPWLMIVLVLLGFAAGVLNVMRAAAELNAQAPVGGDAGKSPDEEEDD